MKIPSEIGQSARENRSGQGSRGCAHRGRASVDGSECGGACRIDRDAWALEAKNERETTGSDGNRISSGCVYAAPAEAERRKICSVGTGQLSQGHTPARPSRIMRLGHASGVLGARLHS